MEENYSKPGQLISLLREEIKKSGAPLVLRNEITKMTAEKVAKRYQEAFQAAWTKIEKISAAPMLEDIAPEVTICQLDLYYAGILKHPESKGLNEDRLRELLKEKYAKLTGTSPAEIEQKKVMELSDTEIPGDWNGPIVAIHRKVDSFFGPDNRVDYCREGRYLSWITDETTVAEVLDNIIEAVKKAM